MKIVQYSTDALDRIKSAVRWVENQKPSNAGPVLAGNPYGGPFWGWITGKGIEDNGIWYHSFVRVNPDFDNPDITINGSQRYKIVEPVIEHFQCAIEVNGQNVPSNTIVRLSFTGYRTFAENDRRAMFAFSHTPVQEVPYLPIHNHLDNNNGGYAFCVMHPGTSVPQPKFAL